MARSGFIFSYPPLLRVLIRVTLGSFHCTVSTLTQKCHSIPVVSSTTFYLHIPNHFIPPVPIYNNDIYSISLHSEIHVSPLEPSLLLMLSISMDCCMIILYLTANIYSQVSKCSSEKSASTEDYHKIRLLFC